MGYQNKTRPDYFDLREALYLSSVDKSEQELSEKYRRNLLSDAQFDLSDLIMEIEDNFNSITKKELLFALEFISDTLRQYEREVYPQEEKNDSND
jgi:hypothetical protein